LTRLFLCLTLIASQIAKGDGSIFFGKGDSHKKRDSHLSLNRTVPWILIFMPRKLIYIFFFLWTTTASAAGITINPGAKVTLNGSQITTQDIEVKPGGSLEANSGAISLSGNWQNQGTFTSGTSTIIFLGSSPSIISGTNTFYKFSCATAGKQLNFFANQKQTIINKLTLTGALNNLILLRSTTPGTQWQLDPQGQRSVDYLDIQDLHNTNPIAINIIHFKDSGNNTDRASEPVIVITSPTNGQVFEDNPIQLTGTVDGIAFSESRTLSEGQNTLTKTVADSSGKAISASVTVYLYSGQLIGAEGGEVYSPDGKVKVVIPPGALTQPTRVRILNIDDNALQSATPGNKSLLSAVECKPYGLVFSKPVAIIYTLNHAEVPGTPVELGFYDSVQKKIISTGQTSTVPTDGYTLSFSIMHFSTYAALKSLTPQSAPIGSGVKIPLPDMFTGTFSHTIPLSVPAGRKGIQPALGLAYRSSNPNSWVGMGFSLNPGYIVRSTRLGPPTYTDNDTFYFITDAGTTELVHLIDNLYQAKIESGFTKFFKESTDSWKVVGKDGSILKLGQEAAAKETSTQGTFSWYLTKAQDTNGNYIDYHYTQDQGKAYLSRIDYTGNETGVSPTNSVEFFLESRNDIPSSYISGSRAATAKRLKEIVVKVNYDLAWRYVLEYAYSADTNRSLLKSVKQSGSDAKSLPVQTFSYQKAK